MRNRCIKQRAGNTSRPNSKGRNAKRVGSEGATIILRRNFWLAPQIAALSPAARALIIELTAMYKGPELSTHIYLSVRDAARRLGLSCLKAASAAFQELVAVGLLTETMGASFAVKGGEASRARAFRLNWKSPQGMPVGAVDLEPLDFQKLDRKQKRRITDRGSALEAYEKRKTTVEDSSTLAACRAEFARRSVEENATPTEGNAKTVSVEQSSTYIYYHGVRGAASSPAALMHAMAHAAVAAMRPIAKPQPLSCELIALRRSRFPLPVRMHPSPARPNSNRASA